MRKITTFAISAVALAGIAAAEVETSAYVGVHSDYIYRGVNLGDNNEFMDFGLDFAGSCDCGLDWYAGVWYASVDGTFGGPDELDLFAGVSKDLGFGTIDLGYISYTYPGTATANDAEIYLGLSAAFAGFDFGVTTSVGTSGGWNGGTWVDLTAGYSYEGIGIELAAGFAFGSAAYANDIDGLATLSATVSYDIAVSDSVTVSPYLTYVLNDDDYDALDGSDFFIDNNDFYGGVSVSYAF